MFTKLFVWMGCKYEMNLMSLINPYLADGYHSIIVANHGLSRLIRFISRFTTHPYKKILNRFYLALHTCVQIFNGHLGICTTVPAGVQGSCATVKARSGSGLGVQLGRIRCQALAFHFSLRDCTEHAPLAVLLGACLLGCSLHSRADPMRMRYGGP